jgi:hypothetical protein
MKWFLKLKMYMNLFLKHYSHNKSVFLGSCSFRTAFLFDVFFGYYFDKMMSKL